MRCSFCWTGDSVVVDVGVVPVGLAVLDAFWVFVVLVAFVALDVFVVFGVFGVFSDAALVVLVDPPVCGDLACVVGAGEPCGVVGLLPPPCCADTIGAVATVANLKEGESTTTIESKTNFFAAIPLGDTARAECTPLHKGRTTMVWQTKITRGDGRLAAIVTQTQMVLKR